MQGHLFVHASGSPRSGGYSGAEVREKNITPRRSAMKRGKTPVAADAQDASGKKRRDLPASIDPLSSTAAPQSGRAWTKDQDETLREAVIRHGYNWAIISSHLSSVYSLRDCQERWELIKNGPIKVSSSKFRSHFPRLMFFIAHI
jgi:hypothetical protein